MGHTFVSLHVGSQVTGQGEALVAQLAGMRLVTCCNHLRKTEKRIHLVDPLFLAISGVLYTVAAARQTDKNCMTDETY